MTRQTEGRRADAGMMAVEMVLLAPVMVAFLLLVVAFGRFVAVRGEVEAATRDAVRAASLERSSGAAADAARRTASASLAGRWQCGEPELGGAFGAGETITVRLECSVPLSGLGLLGMPGSISVHAQSAAPLDLYRRTDG
ncbi:MAG TPA: TadE family protein [Kineosporiaceae bacterium]|nr:TadE family protein [Kineosporiaceae bacterium]